MSYEIHQLSLDQASCVHPNCVLYMYFYVFDDVASPVYQLYLDMEMPYAEDRVQKKANFSLRSGILDVVFCIYDA